jgi:hypothetical protein
MIFGRVSDTGRWHQLGSNGSAKCATHLRIQERKTFISSPQDTCERCQKLENDSVLYTSRRISSDQTTGPVRMDLEPTMCHPDILKEFGIPIPKDEEYRKQYGLTTKQSSLLDYLRT